MRNGDEDEEIHPNWYLERRADLKAILSVLEPVPGSERLEVSPCGRYQFSATLYQINEEITSFGVCELKRADGESIARIESNLGFSCTWVPQHSSGFSYLITHEDYQGFTVIQLETGERVDYIPPEAERGEGFCAMQRHPTPDGKVLYVMGCIWARETELVVFDFSEPMAPPYPELWRRKGDRVVGFREDGFVFSNLSMFGTMRVMR